MKLLLTILLAAAFQFTEWKPFVTEADERLKSSKALQRLAEADARRFLQEKSD